MLAQCDRNGIAFVPYFPLPTGGLDPADDVLRAPAARLWVSISTVALAWILRRSPVTVPIPGTTSIAHLEENLEATAVAPLLTDAEVSAITAAEDEAHAQVHVMPERMQHVVSRPRAS